MAHKLKTGETLEQVAFEILGDKRLTNELHQVGDMVYVRGEKLGPPAKWAAAPPKREK